MRDVPAARGALVVLEQERHEHARPVRERAPAAAVADRVDVEHADFAVTARRGPDPVRVAVPRSHRDARLRPAPFPLDPAEAPARPTDRSAVNISCLLYT